MKYVGLGLWIKPDLNLSDILNVCSLVRHAHNKSLWTRFVHYRKVVQILCGKARFYHAFMIRRVLTAAGMFSTAKVEYDPEKKIIHFVNWLAPRLRMSSKEILTQYDVQSLGDYYREALAFNFKRDVSAALAQHAPVKFHEMVEEMYDYRKEAARARLEEIEETERNPDPNPIRMLGNAFDPGGYHGE